MSHPYHHALSSAQTFPEPQTPNTWKIHLPIHQFLDSSKAHLADARHRALLHHQAGISLAQRLPETQTPPLCQKKTQAIAEQHIREDLGSIPPLKKWISKKPPFPLPHWEKLLNLPKPHLLKTLLAAAQSAQNLQEREKILEILLCPEDHENLIGHPARLLLFTSPGPFLCERLLGPILPSNTPTRSLCEAIIKQTFSKIPSLQDFLKPTKIQPWMYENALNLSQTLKDPNPKPKP